MKRRRSLRIESLEDRRMMAGDVTVVFNDGVLEITGDDAANSIGVYSSRIAGEIEVVGLDYGGAETTINGRSRTTFRDVDGVIADLGRNSDYLFAGRWSDELRLDFLEVRDLSGSNNFDLTNAEIVDHVYGQFGAGRDIIRLRELTVDQVIMDTGDGADTLNMTGLSFNGYTSYGGWDPLMVAVDLGEGFNTMTMYDTWFRRSGDHSKIDIDSGDDGSNIIISEMTFAQSDFRGDFTIDTGRGRDSIELNEIVAWSNNEVEDFIVRTGSGDDTVEVTNLDIHMDKGARAEIHTWSGDDVLTFENNRINNGAAGPEFKINMGVNFAGNYQYDNDTLYMMQDNDIARMYITMGDGALDEVFIANQFYGGSGSYTHSLRIDTGDGADHAEIEQVVGAIEFTLNMGSGNDYARLSHIDVDYLWLHGGSGSGDNRDKSNVSAKYHHSESGWES